MTDFLSRMRLLPRTGAYLPIVYDESFVFYKVFRLVARFTGTSMKTLMVYPLYATREPDFFEVFGTDPYTPEVLAEKLDTLIRSGVVRLEKLSTPGEAGAHFGRVYGECPKCRHQWVGELTVAAEGSV